MGLSLSSSRASRGQAGYFDTLLSAVLAGNQRFWTKYEDDAHCLRTMTRANTVRDLVVDELRKGVGGRKVHVVDQNQVRVRASEEGKKRNNE